MNISQQGIHTGMRRGEILNLKWFQIKNGLIYLKKTKTNEPREIPVNDAVQAVFNRRKRNFKLRVSERKDRQKEYVLTFRGEAVGTIYTAFKAAMKKAGIENFRFHDLRHTFASQLILKGGTLKDVQEILGHKNMTMTLRYSHLTQEHKKNAVSLLNSLPAPKHTEKSTCHKTVTKPKLEGVVGL